MAGDWINMRVDLWDDPRIIRIQSALQTDKAQICGALFRTWSLADQYTEDGRLAGYTIEALDNAVGIAGWSKALQAAGWLAVENDAVTVPRFDEHNGQSAKRRIMERERKRHDRGKSPVRKPSASRADKKRPREEKSENLTALDVVTDCNSTISTTDAVPSGWERSTKSQPMRSARK